MAADIISPETSRTARGLLLNLEAFSRRKFIFSNTQRFGATGSANSYPKENVPRLLFIGALTAAAIYAGAFFQVFGSLKHWPGSESYVRLAHNLLSGAGYSLDGVYPTAERPPLYPLIIAATMRATGSYWFTATVMLQALAAAMCLVMVFKITRIFWPNPWAPWLSAGLLALHGPFMFEMLSIRETVWFTLALLGVAWYLIHPARNSASAVAMGILLASLYLLRPTGLIIGGVTTIFLLRCTLLAQAGAWRRIVMTMVTGMIVVAPWQIFTYRNFGAPGFFPASSNWYNLAKGADAELTAVCPWIDADSLDSRLRRLTSNIPGKEERAVDNALEKIAVDLIRKQPKTVLSRAFLCGVEFVSPLPIPLGAGVLKQAGNEIVIENFRPHWEELAFTPVVLLLLVSAYAGLKSFLRQTGSPRYFGIWMVMVFLSLLVVHALTFTKTRYRLPLDALLAVPAGGWLAGFKRKPPDIGPTEAIRGVE